MSGAVLVVGDLRDADRLHVVEGVADGRAVAAREPGAVIVAGGTATLPDLAPKLARFAVPITAWPDGDPPGRTAAAHLVAGIRRRGGFAAVARVPDPASMGGPFEATPDPDSSWRDRSTEPPEPGGLRHGPAPTHDPWRP